MLVDRVWPRGVTRERSGIDAWLKDLAPSTALRKWFAHDPEEVATNSASATGRELDGQRPALGDLARRAGAGRVTLLYAARDSERNNAVALKDFLEERLRR